MELVKKRISSLNADYISVSSVLEQFIEDNPFCLCPQLLSTERPDRVVSFLMEGHVAVLVDGAPLSLIAPVTFFSLIHSPEDYYLRLPYGNFIRFLRILAILITLLIPGIYVALVTFHQEMIPTELLLAIAASRVPVPFPTIFEVFSMEFAFELIREAGVRIPGIIGNTIGIVGALILGGSCRGRDRESYFNYCGSDCRFGFFCRSQFLTFFFLTTKKIYVYHFGSHFWFFWYCRWVIRLFD